MLRKGSFSPKPQGIQDQLRQKQRPCTSLRRNPPWHSNRLSRLIKTPKLHMGDTGLAASLLGVDAAALSEGREIAGVEVKASATVKNSDFRALRRLQAAHGKRFAAGIVLYDGEGAVRFADKLFAVPFTSLWSRK